MAYSVTMSSSSSSSHPSVFSIVIIRNLKTDGNVTEGERTDDHIRVSRDGQYFNVTYSNKPEGIKQTVSLTANDFFKYLKNTLTLLSNDDEPFSHIQFNFPTVPAVMYKTTNLSMVYDVVMDQIDTMIANWPVTV